MNMRPKKQWILDYTHEVQPLVARTLLLQRLVHWLSTTLEANLPPDRPCLLRLRRDGLRNLSAASLPGGRFGLQAVTTPVTPRRRCHR